MKEYVNIVKRFQFDLKMGRFKVKSNSHFLIRCDTTEELIFLIEIMKSLSFRQHRTSRKTEEMSYDVLKEHNAVLMDTSSGIYVVGFTQPSNPDSVIIPNYIKEYIENGNQL